MLDLCTLSQTGLDKYCYKLSSVDKLGALADSSTYRSKVFSSDGTTSDQGNSGPTMQGLKDLKELHEGSQPAGSIFARLTRMDPEAMASIHPICDH